MKELKDAAERWRNLSEEERAYMLNLIEDALPLTEEDGRGAVLALLAAAT